MTNDSVPSIDPNAPGIAEVPRPLAPTGPYLVERIEHCIAPWTTLAIDDNGETRPCCLAKRGIGNIRHAGLDAVWNGPVVQELRWFIKQGLIHPVCRDADCPFVKNSLDRENLAARTRADAALDETDYAERHPDVAAAIARGEFRNARHHYETYGRDEARMARFPLERMTATEAATPAPPAELSVDEPPPPDWPQRFDDAYYRRACPDADKVIQGGFFSSGLEHFLRVGGLETCFPRRFLKTPAVEWSQRPDVRALQAFVGGETAVPVPPMYLIVTMTTRCNLKCVMCPHGMGDVKDPKDSPMEFAELLRPALSNALRVELVGLGETLLSPLFHRLLAESQFRPDAYVRSNSNGLLLTPENRARVLASGLKELSISCDAATPETYRRIRGADFQRVTQNVAAFVAERRAAGRPEAPKIWLNATLMQANVSECETLVTLAAELGAHGVELQLLAGFGNEERWVVERKSWEFRYADNMAQRNPILVRENLLRALSAGERLGVPVRLKLFAQEREQLGLDGGYC